MLVNLGKSLSNCLLQWSAVRVTAVSDIRGCLISPNWQDVGAKLAHELAVHALWFITATL